MYLVEFELPAVSREQYENVWKILAEKSELAPAGRHYHFGAPAPGGWRVIDVWDDLGKLDRFAQVLVPALVESGITPPQPRVLPIVKTVMAE